MNKQRHRQRSQGGTSPETTPQTRSGVAHFSVSEVVQFSMSVDTLEGPRHRAGGGGADPNRQLQAPQKLAAVSQLVLAPLQRKLAGSCPPPGYPWRARSRRRGNWLRC
jgi:hypothetical protein